MLNVAIIGPGRIADYALAPALAEVEGVQLWSVLSRDMDRARAFAEEHGAVAERAAHTDLTALLGDPGLHAVILATPDALHARQALTVARLGKHLLIEKPMVTDVEDGRLVIEACRKADVRLGVAYHLRWHAGHRTLRDEVNDGALGEPRHIRLRWTFRAEDDSNWRASDAVGRWWSLAGVGTHCIDLALWLMGTRCGEVVETRAVTTNAVFAGPHDETAVVGLRFENGATAEILTSVLFDSESRVEIFGSEANAHAVATLGPHGGGEIRIGDQPMTFPVRNPYAGEIADFASAVRNSREPEVGGAQGLRNVEILTEAMPGPMDHEVEI